MAEPIKYEWRGAITDQEMIDLVASHGGRADEGWWDQVRTHSLGWVSARTFDGTLVGCANVAWDGASHAFLLDPMTRSDRQRSGIGREVLRHAALGAKDAGCVWLHVDFEPHLRPFYFGAGGFRPTDAGLIHLPSLE